MKIVSASVVPHAPVLVPGLSARGRDAGPRPVVDASAVDAVVVVSPHGNETGVYRRVAGSLDAFGVRAFARSVPAAEELAEALAGAWERPLIDGSADHGIVVPLWWLSAPVPVVACTFEEMTGPLGRGCDGVADAAADLAAALASIDAGRTVGVVASAHLSAGLTARAPLGELAGAGDFDDRIVAALGVEPGRMLDVPPAEWRAAGACGLGPLATVARLCPTRPARAVAYIRPFGVGYVTAEMA